VQSESMRTAYAGFVAGRWAALYRTALLMTGEPGEAEDLLQATLVKAYIHWARVARAESPEAYVRRMLVNTFISTRRRGVWRRERGRGEPPEVAVPNHADAALERMNLWSFIRVLPPRQRAVIVLRFYEDMSERQIAEALGCSQGTVKSQASDALRTLRARIGAEPESEGLSR
jgi:RNA polymerase sigma-70 factor (sigma-E family)